MAKYALVRDGVVIQIADFSSEAEVQSAALNHEAVINIENIYPQPVVGWTLVGNQLVSNGQQGSTKLTKLGFRQRFTFTELCNIQAASSTDVRVAVLLTNLSVATFVDLNRADTIGGVYLLVSLGLITSERANTILTAPIQSHEAFKE